MTNSPFVPAFDRRRAVRFAPRGATVEVLDRICTLSDVSTMGMHVCGAPESLEPGDVVVATLLLPRRQAGRPAHRFSLNAMIVARTPAGISLRYLQPTRRWAKALEEYLEGSA